MTDGFVWRVLEWVPGALTRLSPCRPYWSNACRSFKMTDEAKMTNSIRKVGCFRINPVSRYNLTPMQISIYISSLHVSPQQFKRLQGPGFILTDLAHTPDGNA